jgi:hypothetical protein
MEPAGIVVIWMEVGYQSKVNRLLCWDSEYRSFGFSHDR